MVFNGEKKERRKNHVGIFSFVGPLIFKEIHLGKETRIPPTILHHFPYSILTCVFVTKSGLRTKQAHLGQ